MTRTLPLPDGSWRGRALCATGGVDPEWWFPRQGGADEGKAALHWCERCPVQMPCLASALAEEVYADNAFGIRGGLRARERGEPARLQGDGRDRVHQ